MEATSKETVDAGKDENGALSTRWIPGPVRHMKVVKDEAAHRQIYEKVRAISLFVMKLPMYLICESLADVSPELGCTEALAPSWSETQSVWLRMGSRGTWRFCGQAFTTSSARIRIQERPRAFPGSEGDGRSPLEASSFNVSSALPDKDLHGIGFCARVTGSTVEFQSMWTIMMTEGKEFTVNDKSGLALPPHRGRCR